MTLSVLDPAELHALLCAPAIQGWDATRPLRPSPRAISSLTSILASPPTGKLCENTDIIYGVLTLSGIDLSALQALAHLILTTFWNEEISSLFQVRKLRYRELKQLGFTQQLGPVDN